MLEANRTYYRTLLRQAAEQAQAQGFAPGAVKTLLRPAKQLLDAPGFWEHPAAGLAIFCAPGIFQAYRLPEPVTEQIVVGQRFHLPPLLLFLADDGEYFLLAFSQQRVRLFRGSHYSITELALPEGVPASLAEALRYDDPERQRQYYTMDMPAAKGRRAAVFYTQGIGSDERRDELLRYCQRIDRGLQPLLRGERAPLVLAGVDDLTAQYRQASDYPLVLNDAIGGNPDELAPAALHARAWAITEPYFQSDQQVALARYRDEAGTGLTSDNLAEIVAAAGQGRVAVLLLAADTVRKCPTSPANGAAACNLATIETLTHSGTVYAVPAAQLPARATCIALYRY
jgi:hypothetical protein